MEKKDKDKLKRLEEVYSISLKSFLISRCGIWDKSIIEKKLTHKDIKILFPHLKRTSFEYVLKNVKDLCIGNVFLVKDSIGNSAVYFKPELNELTDSDYLEMEECGDIKITDDKFFKAVELENLTLYELTVLSKKYKEEGRITEYRKVCRIIKKNSDVIARKEYKKKKVLMKGFDEDDKY